MRTVYNLKSIRIFVIPNSSECVTFLLSAPSRAWPHRPTISMVGKEWAVLQLQATQALETKWGECKLAGTPCWSLDP